jgi:deoxyribose-phosphate aldolase
MRKRELVKLIDHTLLGPTASKEEVARWCQEAKKYGFASVALNPCHAHLAHTLLKESGVKVCVTIGFPHGMSASDVKAFEAQKAIADGADELDMVQNVAALKEGDYATVLADIRGVCAAAAKAPRPVLVKVILETALLEKDEKIAGAILAKAAGADFVKTSTGFGPAGATVQDVALMRLAVGPQMGVKAAGGIRTLEDLQRMVAAGATRIGASASVKILEAARS